MFRWTSLLHLAEAAPATRGRSDTEISAGREVARHGAHGMASTKKDAFPSAQGRVFRGR